jgi:hypothetical protein
MRAWGSVQVRPGSASSNPPTPTRLVMGPRDRRSPASGGHGKRSTDPLDAKTRERADRLYRPRPRPLKPPDPSDCRLRRWVIGLSLDMLHLEVVRRLEERWSLVHEALTTGPHIWLQDPTLRLPSLIQFLERTTIDDPNFEWNGQRLPMLALRQLPALRKDPLDPRIRYTERTLDAIELTQLAFEDRFFMRWIFAPSPYETKSLLEYQELQHALRELKATRTPRQVWSHVVEELFAESTITVGGRRYAVPGPRWDEKLGVRYPVSEVARLILATKWRCDFQAAKEFLVALRREAPIAAAWTTYGAYIVEDPTRLADIYRVVTRQQPPLLAWPPSWPVVDSVSLS